MTATYRATSQVVATASGKSMIDIAQDTGGSRVVRAYRIYMFQRRTGATTGALSEFAVYRQTVGASAPAGGSTITPVLHDTNSAALAANVTAGTDRTITDSDIFRSFIWSTDEASVGGANMEEWEIFVPFAEVWNAGYGDSNVEPIVSRAGEGVHLKHVGTSTAGQVNLEIEFTDAAS